jgi:hypothetical protein
MSAFPQETTACIARKFYGYFWRKAQQRLTYREARVLIDNVSGPVPPPSSVSAIDYSRPRVSGGGRPRPTDSEVESIFRRHEEEPSAWDDVFDELLRRHETDRETRRLIFMTFRDKCGDGAICEEMHISRSAYYDKRRSILERAGVIAVELGLLKP